MTRDDLKASWWVDQPRLQYCSKLITLNLLKPWSLKTISVQKVLKPGCECAPLVMHGTSAQLNLRRVPQTQYTDFIHRFCARTCKTCWTNNYGIQIKGHAYPHLLHDKYHSDMALGDRKVARRGQTWRWRCRVGGAHSVLKAALGRPATELLNPNT